MAKLQIPSGTASKRIAIFVQDSSSTTGAGLTGLAFGTSGLVCYSWIDTDGNAGGTSQALQTATLGTWTTRGFKEKDATNLPGFYEFGVPDALIAAGVKWAVLMFKGATNMAPLVIEIEVTAVSNQDAVRGGMTALPNANAEAAGGLYTRGTGAGQIAQDANGNVRVNVDTIKTNAVVNAGTITFPTTATLASTTNITAGTIATVTNLTNAPTAGDFTAVMKTSIGTAVAASAVASVTARVTANTDQLAGQTVTAAAGVTFPSSVASPTNITAGTITTATTATNLTNAPTNGDFTAVMKTSIGTAVAASAVASVTGAVASVTGNVGGNVTGSVGSVVGAVGSVTAAVAITSNVKKNQALAKFQFLMTDSTNHNPVTGKIVTVTRSIDNGAFAAGALSAVTEIGNGMYSVDFAAADLNGNVIVLQATAATSDTAFERIVTQP